MCEGDFVDGEMTGRGVRTGPGGKREGAVFSTGLLVSGRIEVSRPAELAQRRARRARDGRASRRPGFRRGVSARGDVGGADAVRLPQDARGGDTAPRIPTTTGARR